MNVLEVQGLTKRYPAFTLNGVSFDVPQGAVMGFIGRNGAGKSTTLKSILGMVHPDAGAVRVFGMDYAENERAIRRELGVVLGGIDFYPKKKIKTITDVTRRFYNNWDEEKYRHYLELFHIDESKRVDQLSSGMKVKYMIALALSHNARLLILDEPTSGLHFNEVALLLAALFRLRDAGHTILCVEHHKDLLNAADYLVDMGPGAGTNGGRILAQGSLAEILENAGSPTGEWLSGKRSMPASGHKTAPAERLVLTGADKHNLNNVTLNIPVGTLTCISGPSGSGKSTLVRDCLIPAVRQALSGKKDIPRRVQGTEHFNRLVVIDQSPIGKTPRSTPATATGLLQVLRPLYAQLPLSKQRGYTAARFSPNIRGGRCERCQGTGMIEVDMNFLGNVAMPCDACHGQCYNRETLEVTWKGKSIAQALALTVDEAAEFFSSLPRAAAILKSMQDVGLGYLNLNRRADTLSGGESQRIKIAAELAKAPSWKLAEDGKRALFILDEPTNGLDPSGIHEIRNLVKSLPSLYDCTVLISSHMLSEIELIADDIGILNHGRLLFEGSMNDLRQYALQSGFAADNLEDVFLSMVEKDNMDRKQRAKL